jgi:hypothetical protein
MVTLHPNPKAPQDTGHQIIEMLNADRTLRIEMAASTFVSLRISMGKMVRFPWGFFMGISHGKNC